jgi:hypothetical protein
MLGVEQSAKADLLADTLFEDQQFGKYQKGVPAGAGGLVPPFYDSEDSMDK